MKRWLNKIAGFWGGYRRISPSIYIAFGAVVGVNQVFCLILILSVLARHANLI